MFFITDINLLVQNYITDITPRRVKNYCPCIWYEFVSIQCRAYRDKGPNARFRPQSAPYFILVRMLFFEIAVL